MKKSFDEISAIMSELASYTKMKKELEVQLEALQTEVKEYMEDNNLEELLAKTGEKAYYKEVISNRFDSTAFKKSEWGELYKEFTKPSVTKPFKFYC